MAAIETNTSLTSTSGGASGWGRSFRWLPSRSRIRPAPENPWVRTVQAFTYVRWATGQWSPRRWPALERSFALEAGLLVEGRIQVFLGLAEGLAAAAHDDPGRLEELLEREARCDAADTTRR